MFCKVKQLSVQFYDIGRVLKMSEKVEPFPYNIEQLRPVN